MMRVQRTAVRNAGIVAIALLACRSAPKPAPAPDPSAPGPDDTRPGIEPTPAPVVPIPEPAEPPASTPLWPASVSISDAELASQWEPGLWLRTFQIGGPIDSLLDLVPGQTANVSKVIPALELDGERGDFGLDDRYLTFVDGVLRAPVSGEYAFRLHSDDGSALWIDGKQVIDHDGLHSPSSREGRAPLAAGFHTLEARHFEEQGGAELELRWQPPGVEGFVPIRAGELFTRTGVVRVTAPGKKRVIRALPRGAPGDGRSEEEVHPAYTLATVRPDGFEPRVGGIDWLPDGRMLVCTWDSIGAVYALSGTAGDDPSQIRAVRIAAGLAEPLGLRVIDGRIFVLQKQELTELIDHDGDSLIDEYRCVCSGWNVSSNFHEFAFGLVHHDGRLYCNLAVAIDPGGKSTQPQVAGRGSTLAISVADGTYEVVAHGLRTPNGIGLGAGGEIFITDNQGDWLPSSKLVHLERGAFYGSRAVLLDAAADLAVTPPVVWFPQDEIGNSPSEPALVPPGHGPYSGQMIHGDVTHGGVKRVFVEVIDGVYQGCVFRFTQGLEAGVNRSRFGPDGALYVGGIGSTGNWGQAGKHSFGLQRLRYNGASAFEMLAVRALSNGLELEFTEPLAAGSGWDPSAYELEQWWYQPTSDYGGRKQGERDLRASSASVSDDRRRVFLELDGLEEGHVVHVRLAGPVLAESGRNPWTTEAWYTLNRLPLDRSGVVRARPAPADNALTAAEREAGWRLLFDGATTAGWRGYRQKHAPECWVVEDGALTRKPADGVACADLVTDEEFDDFELSLEWRIASGGNSGIMYRVGESYGAPWETGPEMQVLDGAQHPDGRNPLTSAGACFALYAPPFDATYPPGQWNRARIVVEGARVEHWLNGHELLEYELGSADWQARIAGSKFSGVPDFGAVPKGVLVLQDHGDAVSFRNIKLRARGKP